jgi:hypothetical protein
MDIDMLYMKQGYVYNQICSMYMLKDIEMQKDIDTAWTCSIDMVTDILTTGKCSKDIQHGNTALTCSMYSTCCRDMQHQEAA